MQRNERRMIHCSFDLVDKFVPRIPKNRCIGEDATIPRICAGQTIRGCLSSMPKAGDTMHRMRQMGLPVIIHAYYMRCKHAVFDIKDYVPDATTTGEIWLLESPSEIHRVDYEIRFERCMWYTDPYGQQQRYPVGVRLRRTKYQDNIENFADNYCQTETARKEMIEYLQKITFRTFISNIDDEMAGTIISNLGEIRRMYMEMHHEEYEKIKDKVILCYGDLPDPLPDDKTVIKFVKFGEYYEKRFKVVHNGAGLTTEQCAIAADEGNLCFGYHTKGDLICVHTD